MVSEYFYAFFVRMSHKYESARVLLAPLLCGIMVLQLGYIRTLTLVKMRSRSVVDSFLPTSLQSCIRATARFVAEERGGEQR